MRRLYLSDAEARRAVDGPLLVVRPVNPQPPPPQPNGGGLSFADALDVWGPRTGRRRGEVFVPCGSIGHLPSEMKSGIRSPWAAGDVLLGREAWACSQDFDGQPIAGQLADSDSIWYRASIAPREEMGIATPMEASHGHWRPAPQMPAHAVRHRLRVVRVTCRPISSITEAEVGATGCPIPISTDGCPPGKGRPLLSLTGRYPAIGFMPDGPRSAWTTADYLRAIYASAWMERHGKRAAWPGAWAWFITTEKAP